MLSQEKKKKMTNILIWVLLAIAVAFVIITSSVIKYKKDKLEDLSRKNAQIEEKLKEEDVETEEV